MITVFYVIAIEAIICGFMLNRSLFSRTKHMWHMPIYVLVKAIVCTLAVYYGLQLFVTPLCILFSLIYAFLCFRDSIKRKLAVVLCGVMCLGASNIVKFGLLRAFGVTQNLKATEDELLTVSILCFSIMFFCLFTIICTNLLCGVRAYIISGITLVHLLIIVIAALIYAYIHNMIAVLFNSLFSVYALFMLLPATGMLYLSESIVFARKDNYFKN